MQDEIVKKLQRCCLRQIDNEYRVVYLMSRIRKLIENAGSDKKKAWKVLNFYCNWCLHNKITRDSGTKYVVDEIDKEGPFVKAKLLMDFISFRLFRDNLRAFFVEFGLPCNFIKNEEKWELFLESLLGAISDCPLGVLPNIFPNRRSKIKAFILRPMKRSDAESMIRLDIKFTDNAYTARDGKEISGLSIVISRKT